MPSSAETVSRSGELISGIDRGPIARSGVWPHYIFMSNAIPGLSLDPKLTAGFRVVGADRNACPQHFGVFRVETDAAAWRDALNAGAAAAGIPSRYRVKPWKQARRRR